ncbi:MAG: site-2 protease family protein, partial [Planctomycetes bacterium]|nr:site-2 protease family protein [Planctomycetota bacterium]
PIPPLDGSRVMTFLLPASLRGTYNRFESVGVVLVLALVMLGLLGPVLYPMMRTLGSWADVLTGGYWA